MVRPSCLKSPDPVRPACRGRVPDCQPRPVIFSRAGSAAFFYPPFGAGIKAESGHNPYPFDTVASGTYGKVTIFISWLPTSQGVQYQHSSYCISATPVEPYVYEPNDHEKQAYDKLRILTKEMA